MTNRNLLLLAGGVGVAGVAGYFILRSRSAMAGEVPTSVGLSRADQEARDLAAIRAAAGAKAVSQSGSSGLMSLINQVTSQASGKFSNLLANEIEKTPGGSSLGQSGAIIAKIGGDIGSRLASQTLSYTGKAAKSVGSTVVSGLKKLKFW